MRKVPIHRSLIRPILLGGAERELAITNMALVASLLLGIGLTKITIITAIFLLTAGQFFIITMGKRDPLMMRVYIRHIHYQDFYPAHGSRLARSSLVHSSIKGS